MSMHRCTVCVTSFSTGGKFQQVSNFTKLHALTLAAHSCALLTVHVAYYSNAVNILVHCIVLYVCRYVHVYMIVPCYSTEYM